MSDKPDRLNVGSDRMSVWMAEGEQAFRVATIHTTPADAIKFAAVDNLLAACRSALSHLRGTGEYPLLADELDDAISEATRADLPKSLPHNHSAGSYSCPVCED